MVKVYTPGLKLAKEMLDRSDMGIQSSLAPLSWYLYLYLFNLLKCGIAKEKARLFCL